MRALGGALGGGAIAFTLMACYGCPPSDTMCLATDAGADEGGKDGGFDVTVGPPHDAGSADADAAADAGADAAGADAGDDAGD